MSEVSPGIEPTISKAIKQSADYAFGSKPKEPQLLEKIRKVEEGSRGIKEQLLGMVRTVAKEARNYGLDIGGIASSADRACAAAIWKTAQSRVEQKMQTIALLNPGLVMATLNELDPMDVQVENRNAQPSVPQRMVRRSVGLEKGTRVRFVESRAQSKFHENPDKSDQVILGGQSFAKEAIVRTLKGKGHLKPMWRRDGVAVPLIHSQTGETYIVSLTGEQLKNLREVTVEPEKINIAEIKYGAHGLSALGHPREDDFGNQAIVNKKGESIGLRVYGIDGSGTSLKGTNFPEVEHPKKIVEKVRSIKSNLQRMAQMNATRALDHVNDLAMAETANPAYAGVVVVDIYKDHVEGARRGDHSVVRWRPQGFEHRRSEAWGPNQGDPSYFQSVDMPQNLAYAAKSIAVADPSIAGETRYLEETEGANKIYSAVGFKGQTATFSFERSNQTEYMLVLSDGARGSGMMLDPNEKYSQQVHAIMTDLSAGKIQEKEAAKKIAIAARQIPREDDDISVQVVKLPPKA